MHRPLCCLLIVAGLCSVATAQNQPSYEQLQNQYNDALKQLKVAQDRKNELADENAKLHKRLEDGAKQLQDKQDELDSLRNRTYFLRAHYSAWETFLDANPRVKAMWAAYFTFSRPPEAVREMLGDGSWPFTLPD
jgi:septal ring factor EnvC (AmiA/AmiB activator)